MFHNSQLLAYGWYGKVDPSVFSFNLGGEKALASAQARGGFRGLKRYAEGQIAQVKANHNGKLNFHDKYGDINHCEIGLDFKLWIDSTLNTLSAWTPLIGDSSYLERPSNPFPNSRGGTPIETPALQPGSIPGLLHAREQAGTLSAYQGYPLLANYPWAIRLGLHPKPQSQDFDLFQLRWGSYQISFINGSPYIMRLAPDVTNSDGTTTPGWSQSAEDALNNLLAVSDPTDTQTASIETQRAAIYKDYQSLSLGDESHDAAFKTYTLVFIPVAEGRLLIVNGRGHVKVVNNTDILMTRQPGTLWPATNVQVRRNGGAYSWQCGYPVFAATGSITYSPYNANGFSLGALISNLLTSCPPGTSVSLANAVSSNSGQITVTLTPSSDHRLSPMFFWGFAYTAGGARTGGSTEVFPTGMEDPAGDPIINVTPTYEVDNHTSGLIRASYEVIARNIKGQTFIALPSNYHYEALENRVASLSQNSTGLVTNGLIKKVTLQEMADCTENQIPANVMRAGTVALLTLCDMSAILEELYTNSEVGDGLHLGAYLRALLMNCGFTSAEVAGISATAGRKLPQGLSAEEPCVRPGEHMKYAAWIRDVLLKYGMGLYLYQDGATGVWTLAARATSVQSLYGYPINFISRPYAYDANSYPGRFTILEPLEAPRDSADFFNYIEVRGGEDYQGNKLVQWWRNDSSIALTGGNNPGKDFLGRLRPLIIEDTALRTADDVAYALRSAQAQYGIPPRFWRFKTFHIPGLNPYTASCVLLGGVGSVSGGVETIDTTNSIACRLESVSGNSAADEMELLFRELQ